MNTLTTLFSLGGYGSYLAIIFFLVICGFGVPVPEEVPVVLAGVLASQGTLQPWPAWLACVIGAIGGDSVMYAIGYFWGHGLLAEHPRFAKILHAEREPRFEQAISDHSFKVLFLARFMVGIRAPVYLAAGIVRIPYLRFLMMDILCATVVVSTFFSLAYAYGESIIRWIRNAEITFTIAVLAIVGIIVAYVYFSYGRKMTRKLIGPTDDAKQNVPADEPREKEAVDSDRESLAKTKRVG